MSNMRARSLPRVREALEKAERARFYKQRTNKYTDEVRLVKALASLENERISALAQIKQQTLDLRMQALHIRDEEKAFMEDDLVKLRELTQKVEAHKHRSFLLDAKYKPKRVRQQFIQRYERWQAEDAAAEDWREELPARQPQIHLNDQLIYPAKRERKHNRQLYQEITRRPDSQLAEKAIRNLQDLYADGDFKTTEDKAFFEELLGELNSAREADTAADEASPFVTQQMSLVQAVQERSMQRILSQIASTRRSIRFWEVPASEVTKDRLGECCQRRKYRVRRLKDTPRPTAAETAGDAADEQAGDADEEAGGDDEAASVVDAGKNEGVRFRRAGGRRMSKKSGHVGTASGEDAEDARELDSTADDGGAGDGEGEGVGDEERERVRRLSKRLSRSFRGPDEFSQRRQSLMRELDEEEVSPEERERRMRVFEKAWAEVLKSKLIRGYDPPDMKLPEGQTATDFVFGEAQSRVLDRIEEEAANAAAVEKSSHERENGELG